MDVLHRSRKYTTFHRPRPVLAHEKHWPPDGRRIAAYTHPTSHGARPGPAGELSSRWAAAWTGPPMFQMMGCGLAPPFKIFDAEARPGPAHQLFKSFMARPGPAHHIFNLFGPAHHILKSTGPSQPGPLPVQTFRPSLARPITIVYFSPAQAGPYYRSTTSTEIYSFSLGSICRVK